MGGGLAVVGAALLHLVAGVKQIYVLPLVKEPQNPPIFNCTIPEDSLLQSTPYWYKAGVHSLGRRLHDEYEILKSTQEMEVRHAESLASASARLNTGETMGQCETRKMLLNQNLSFGDAFCDCASSNTADKTCSNVGDYVRETKCHSEYSFDQGLCSEIEETLADFSDIASTCIVNNAGSTGSLDLYMRNYLFPIGTQLPETIDTEAADSQVEGRSMYLAWMAADRLTRYATHEAKCLSSNPIENFGVLPGWETEMIFRPGEEAEMRMSPYMTFSRRGKEQFLLVIRDSITSYEGRLEAQYEPAMKYINHGRPSVPEGVASMLQATTGPLDLFFMEFFNSNWNATELSYDTNLIHPRLVVVGTGNYGGAYAAAMAEYFAAKWAGDDKPWASIFRVDAILFNAPRAGSADFASSFRRLVNSRNLISKFNAATTLPCESQMLCPPGTSAIPTADLIGEIQNFAPLGGLLELDPRIHPTFAEGDLVGWDLPETRFDFVAQDICAVKCWLSASYCPDDPADMCTPVTCPTLLHVSA